MTPKPIERTPSGQYLKDSIRLYHPNTGYIKRQFYDDVAAGNYHFPIDVDQMVLDQMSSETLVERQKGGRIRRYYVKKVIDDEAGNPTSYQNHQLDCYVYARMMLEILLSNAKQHGGSGTYTDAAGIYYRRKKRQRKQADTVGVK